MRLFENWLGGHGLFASRDWCADRPSRAHKAMHELAEIVEENVYRTEMASRFSSSESIWPPTARTAIERRSSAPGPVAISSGTRSDFPPT